VAAAPNIDADLDDLDVRAAAAGDREALGRLVARHTEAIHRVATILTHSPEVADDVVQETALAALRHIASFRGEGSARAWLLQIARHAAHRLARRPAGQPSAHVDIDAHDDLAALGVAAGWGQPARDPERDADVHQRQRMLRSALLTLAEPDRLIVQLRDIEGLTTEEVAHVLGLPTTTVKPRLHRARLRLMAILRERLSDGP